MLIHEHLLQGKASRKTAEDYKAQFPDQMNALIHESPLSETKGVTDQDIVTVGQQLDMFESYVEFCHEAGTASDLGVIPNIAIDIISGSYGASVLPLFSSVQNLAEEQGLVYFKQVRAEDTRGNINAGDIIRDPRSATQIYQSGYAGENVGPVAVSATAPGDTNYLFGLTATPVRPRTVTITIPSLGIEGIDNGKGDIVGVGIQGTIDYPTGAVEINLVGVVPSATEDIIAEFATEFEASGQVPRMNTVIDSISVKAEIFALRGQTGLFKNWTMRKRFGKLADQEMVNDLTGELTAELNYRGTGIVLNNTPGTPTTFNPVPSGGVSYYEHKQEFLDKVSQAEVKILNQAGKGRINVMLAGTEIASLYSNMPKFVRSNIDSDGPHVYGTYDNVTVIRCPNYPTLEAVGLYRGPGMFDAPLVYAPYMPLFIGSTIPSPDNILINESLAAIWSAFKSVVPNYTTKIVLSNPLSAVSP
jgi:hypothetical protein